MKHSIETCTRIGFHERLQMPIWECPECGRKIIGERVAGQCGGPPPAIVENLDCVHRLEKVGTVPCGTCPATNRPKQASVYLCKAEGGRACTLRPVGNGPEQQVHGALPVVCATCPIRQPPSSPVS